MTALVRIHLVIGYWFQGNQMDAVYGTNGYTNRCLDKAIFTVGIACPKKGILPIKHKNKIRK